MATTIYDRKGLNPLLLVKIVKLVVDNVHIVSDLLSCLLEQHTECGSLKKLYKDYLVAHFQPLRDSLIYFRSD